MERGEIWWADLSDPLGSAPGHRRPLLVVQSNAFNRSRIGTVIAAVITSNIRLADAPGNVLLPSKDSRLPKDSVINVSQLITIDKNVLTDRVSKLSARYMRAVVDGLALVLDLSN